TLWQTEPELAFELHRERGELEYLNGDFASARAWVATAIERETDRHRQAELYRMRVTQHTLMAEYHQAIRIGAEGLALFGVSLPDQDHESARDQELDRVEQLLNGRPLAALADLAWMTDPEQIAIMRLLITLGPPCYRYHPGLWSVIVAREIRMCLEYGTLPVAAYSFPAYGGLLIHTGRGTGDDCRVLYETTQALITRCEQAADRSVGHLMMGSSLRHWFSPLAEASGDYLNAYESGLESGNLQYAVYGFGHNTYCRFFQGTALDTLIPEVQGYLAFTSRRGNQWGIDLIEGALRVFHDLRGDSPGDPETTYIDRCAEHGNRQVLCVYHILCSEAAALKGYWRQAAYQLEQARPLIDTVSAQGLLPVTRYHGLRALIAAQYPDSRDSGQVRALLNETRDRFAGWAQHAPANFSHWQWLMEAELARLDGDMITAMATYDQALEQVRGQRLPNAVALVARLAAGLWERQGKSDFADLYWGHFQRAAQQWQAHALLEATPHRQGTSPAQSPTDLDLPAVIRIAEALSLHTHLAELVPEITRNVAHQTGAQRVALLLERHGSLVLAMDSQTERNDFFHEPPELESRDDLPRSVLRYVARTHESFRFSRQDIENSLLLRSDPYFRTTVQDRTRTGQSDASTVDAGWCIPLMVLGECAGVLYMEHRLISEAFDDTREPLIEFLAAQGAISIRTVELINRLAEEARARREAELRIQNADAEISMRKEHERNLRQLATTDFLTGLPNRRTLMERLEEEWNRQQRHSPMPAVLLMLDVDHFKQINDRFGHGAGDQVLCDLADLFRRELRNFDLPARLGGEEFAMLVHDVDREKAVSIAERLRERIAESPSSTTEGEIPFTVSIGIAGFAPEDRSHEAVLQRADKALYRAKSEGRNRVCLSSSGDDS
ncbi:MAG: sensor domain-containing diguanylate cyclase, partial [Pseudomonadota bacterium]